MPADTDSDIVHTMEQLDAREFGVHVKQGGWRLGLLVARNVEPGTGDRSVSRRDRVASIAGKVSASKFAADSATSMDRVMRYYQAWERASSKGLVPPAATLGPGDEVEGEWDHLPEWGRFYNPGSFHPASSGQVNLRDHLGKYGDRLFRSHKRLLTFFEKDLPGKKPGKRVQELAGRYADCLEAEASVLRKIALGEPIPDKAEIKDILDPTRFFETA